MRKAIIYFHRKKIVYSRIHAPAQFYKAVEIKGKHYIRCIVTNLTFHKSHPLIEIPVNDIYGIRIIPSKFDLWLDKILGRKRSKKVTLRPFTK